jgi:hypothetical protein
MNFISSYYTERKNQDFIQRITVIAEVIIEMYRVVTGTFLIMFVPQNCNGNICNFTQNVFIGKPEYDAIFIINIITLFVFIIMYYIEMNRENQLINYLDVNTSMSNDNDMVGEVISKLDSKKKESILFIDKCYIYSGFASLFFFALNTIFSGIIIFSHYLDNKTYTTFITNILFMAIKLYYVYCVVTTKENVFYSAYLRNFIQYNDLDETEKKILESTKLSKLTKLIEVADIESNIESNIEVSDIESNIVLNIV